MRGVVHAQIDFSYQITVPESVRRRCESPLFVARLKVCREKKGVTGRDLALRPLHARRVQEKVQTWHLPQTETDLFQAVTMPTIVLHGVDLMYA